MTSFDLFSSVRDNNTSHVRTLLQNKQCRAKLNERNEWGDTALHLAAELGNAEICQMLIAGGASVTVRNNRGETCLHRAAVGGHVNAVSAIVARDQDPEAVNSQNDAGYTALHHAAKHGSKELIEILISAGADRLLENNAGETPYMVAKKYQQWEAEKHLLNMEKEHADQAIRAMNRKEKDIVRAYYRALKYATHKEFRTRVFLIGDRGTGKTSLKKTLFGEPYDPDEKPSSGIHADLSVTRIQCRQYKEWVQQPSSIADSYRLNLEYTDNLITYILDDIKKPKVYDDAVDGTAFQTEKGPAKSVRFAPTNDYIAPDNHDYGPLEEEVNDANGKDNNTAPGVEAYTTVEQRIDLITSPMQSSESEIPVNTSEAIEDVAVLIIREGEEVPISVDPLQMNRIDGVKDDQEPEDDIQDDDRLHRFAMDSDNMAAPEGDNAESEPPTAHPQTAQSTQQPKQQHHHHHHHHQPQQQNPQQTVSVPVGSGKPEPPARSGNEIQDSLFPKSCELTRLLVEKIPVEILKRTIMRWPVQDEHTDLQPLLVKDRMAITVWDASGDPLQQNFIPLFFTTHTIYVVMYNIKKPLDDISSSFNTEDSCTATNAEVMEDWIGCVTAFSKPIPSEPFRCTKKTPVLPSLILTCTHDDNDDNDNETPLYNFNPFFSRHSFKTYSKHLLESSYPTAVRISNKQESNTEDEEYCGHHILRREIDYLARQMPYAQESIPVQWVRFEQLVYGLLEQRKVILLYDDIAKYVAEHCKLTDILQLLPMLSYFHDVGVLVFFYRHPLLKKLVVVKPQWLIDALAAVITSSSGKWITAEVKEAFKNLTVTGTIRKEVVSLAYRCARLPSRNWNEFLFILNCMDLVCCHPCLHEQKSLYIPCMIAERAPPNFFITLENDPAVLEFSCSGALPIALYNQLVTCCIRNSQYTANIFKQHCHIRINQFHHLIIKKEHSSIDFLVQSNSSDFCSFCKENSNKYMMSPSCSHIRHLLGEDVEILPSDIAASLCDQSDTQRTLSLALSDEADDLHQACIQVLSFLSHTLEYLCECWFPGLKLSLTSNGVTLDQYWKHTVLKTSSVSKHLAVWFDH